MSRLIDVIRSAIRADAASLSLASEGDPGAAAPLSTQGRPGAAEQEDGMSQDVNSGAAPAATVSRAEHDAAVAAARRGGEARGARAATDRLTAALAAEGVKGDAGRMAAALDLAAKAPSMSGEDIAAFVSGNVAPAAASGASAYETQRLAASGLAQPGPRPGRKATIIDAGAIYGARRKQHPEG